MQPEILSKKLNGLRVRAGFTIQQLSDALGYKYASGAQRLMDPNLNKKEYLAKDRAEGLMRAMVGEGSPPIKQADILELFNFDWHQAAAPENTISHTVSVFEQDNSNADRLPLDSLPQDDELTIQRRFLRTSSRGDFSQIFGIHIQQPCGEIKSGDLVLVDTSGGALANTAGYFVGTSPHGF